MRSHQSGSVAEGILSASSPWRMRLLIGVVALTGVGLVCYGFYQGARADVRLDDDEVRRQLRDVREGLAELREITPRNRRLEADTSEAFATLIDQTEEVENRLHQLMTQDSPGFQPTSIILIAVGLFLLTAGGVAFRRFEHGRVVFREQARLVHDTNEMLEEKNADHARVVAALHQSEKRFEMICERAPLAFQSLDENGHVLFVNQAWLDLLGYSREEVTGRWFGDFLPAEDREQFRESFLCLKAEGEVRGVEFVMKCRNGHLLDVILDGNFEVHEKGQFKQTQCILQNITDRKQAEQALRESEAQKRVILDGTTTSIAFVNKDLEILWANKAAATSVGKTPEEMIGHKCHAL